MQIERNLCSSIVQGFKNNILCSVSIFSSRVILIATQYQYSNQPRSLNEVPEERGDEEKIPYTKQVLTILNFQQQHDTDFKNYIDKKILHLGLENEISATYLNLRSNVLI